MTREERAHVMLGRYAQIRQRTEAQIQAGRPEFSEAERALLVEQEYARSIVELEHPELMQAPEWRTPGAVLAVVETGKHRANAGRPVAS